VLFITAAALIAAGGQVIAGPPNPPAGPVISTYKTLTEVEPRIAISATNTPGDADSLFKIIQPGSYYLTGNITGIVGKGGIEIAASGVTIDLNGFDLSGIPGMGGFDGVTTSVANLTNITIRNGSVRGWGLVGVNLSNPNLVTNCAIIDVRASGNGSNGIMGGAGGTITGCLMYSNSGGGISAGNGCTISNCTARVNTLDGIVVAGECTVLANTCSTNGSTGNGAGIHATGNDNRIEGNTCTNADRGIDVNAAGNIIIKNTCSGNTIGWVIVANNVFGPIIDRRVPASPAVSGFTAFSTLGSTDPNANFTY